eukprot:362822-Chlamydomonas_euryale.AAC.30
MLGALLAHQAKNWDFKIQQEDARDEVAGTVRVFAETCLMVVSTGPGGAAPQSYGQRYVGTGASRCVSRGHDRAGTCCAT